MRTPRTRVRLRDGTRAVIHAYEPLPREVIEDAYDHLSPESQFHRFLTASPHLTDAMYHHLVDDIDGVDHVVLVMALSPERSPRALVGVARCVRYPDRPDTADVAVTVREDCHGRGIATALLAELMRRRPAGVTRLATLVAADNPAALAMLRPLGRTTVSPPEDGIQTVEVELPELPA